MKENGIPKKIPIFVAGAHILNRLYSDCGAAISLFCNALVPFTGGNFGGGAAYICAVVYSRLFCKL